MQDFQYNENMIPANATPKQKDDSHRPFMCPDIRCGRRFNRKYTLTEHMKTHTGERPHVCHANGCGKRFSTSGNLSRHLRLHGAVDPVYCPIDGCTSKFTSYSKLTNHMRSHYVPRIHTCKVPDCGKLFSTTGNLNRHLKNQHTQRECELFKSTVLVFPLLRPSCRTPTSQKYSEPMRQSPTGIDEQWGGNTWESKPETIHVKLLSPLKTPCMTPWTPEMLHILSEMLFD